MANTSNPFEKLLAQTRESLAKKNGQVGPIRTASTGSNEQSIPKVESQTNVEADRREAETSQEPEAFQPERNPFLTEQTSIYAEPSHEPAASVTNVDEGIDSVYALARIDTDVIEAEPQQKPVFKNEVSEAAKLTKAMILEDAASVRKLADLFDSKLRAIPSLAGPDLADLRNQVQTIMITLKEHPEFDSVLLADDWRNVIRWIRAIREESVALRTVKTEKKVARQIKKESGPKLGTPDAFAGAFNSIMFNPGGLKK